MSGSNQQIPFSLETIGDQTDLATIAQIHDDNVATLLQTMQGGLSLQGSLGATIIAIPITMPPVQWMTPTLLNSWVNKGGTNVPARFRIDSNGLVTGQGLVKSGTLNTIAYTMPKGYPPDELITVPAVSNNGSANGYGTLTIDSSGNVLPADGIGTASFSLSFSYYAAQPAAGPPRFNSARSNSQGLSGWPLQVKHNLKNQCVMLFPVRVFQNSGIDNTPLAVPGSALPMPRLDWADDGNGNVDIYYVDGLSPGGVYTVYALALSG